MVEYKAYCKDSRCFTPYDMEQRDLTVISEVREFLNERAKDRVLKPFEVNVSFFYESSRHALERWLQESGWYYVVQYYSGCDRILRIVCMEDSRGLFVRLL